MVELQENPTLANIPVMSDPQVNTGPLNQNPDGMGLFELLKEDYRTHDRGLFEHGFWAVAVHRFGNWRLDIRPKFVQLPFSILYKLLYRWVEWTCGITVPHTVKLGRRVRIWHHSGIILSARSIGNDVHIRQNTTFGVVTNERPGEVPTIEDGVDVGCGAVILGPITVGHHSVIGANAVVLKDVPPRSVAVGVPAKVIKTLDESKD